MSQPNRQTRRKAQQLARQRQLATQGNQRQMVPRNIPNPAKYHFQGWVTLGSKPEVPAAQTVASWHRDLTVANLAGVGDFMSRYQMFVLNSLGARFKSAVSMTHGQVCMFVLTEERRGLTVIPNPITHAFVKPYGSQARQLSTNVPIAAPPSANVAGLKQYRAANAQASLGRVWFVYEGPQAANALTHLGEIEVYVDVLFEGL